MRYDICILSDESDFAHMLRLELESLGCKVALAASPDAPPAAALYFVDADRFPTALLPGRILRYGRSIPVGSDEGWHRPFRLAALASLADGDARSRGLRLLPQENAVLLDGEHIRLTAKEFALLSVLADAAGRPVSRESLRIAVFSDEKEAGIVNVYIHYLRRKLERDGRRLIVALRGQGYALRRGEEV